MRTRSSGAALWVVSRHPDWSGEVVKLLRTRFRAPEFPPGEAEAVQEALVSLCGSSETQKMMSDALDGAKQQRLFLLDTMDQCAVKELPSLWTEKLRGLLSGKHAAVRARVIALVRSRQITALDDEMEQLSASEREPSELRAAALGVLVSRRPTVSESGFRFLLSLLRPDTDAGLR